MYRKIRVMGFFGALSPSGMNSHDNVEKGKTNNLSLYKTPDTQTGWERLQKMFSTDEFGNLGPEIVNVTQTAFFGSFLGGCYGGFLSSRKAYMEFIERNQATTFSSHLDAKRQLQNHVTVNMGKGAFRWGWRVGFFSSSYVLISTALQTYRGESHIIDYVIAGGVTGAVYRMHLGIRGFLVAGLCGSVLGLVTGGTSMLLLSAFGTSVEEIRFWQYKWKIKKDNMLKEQMAVSQGYEDPLMKWHDEASTKETAEKDTKETSQNDKK